MNKSRSWFFEKIKWNQQAFKQIHQEKEREDPNKCNQKWKGEITTDTTEIQKIVRNYYKELYAKKFENLGEMDKFLEKYNLLKLNEEGAESLNRPITADEIEAVIRKLLAHKSPGLEGFTGEFYKAFKEEPYLSQTITKNPREWKYPNLFLGIQHHPNPKTR